MLNKTRYYIKYNLTEQVISLAEMYYEDQRTGKSRIKISFVLQYAMHCPSLTEDNKAKYVLKWHLNSWI